MNGNRGVKRLTLGINKYAFSKGGGLVGSCAYSIYLSVLPCENQTWVLGFSLTDSEVESHEFHGPFVF